MRLLHRTVQRTIILVEADKARVAADHDRKASARSGRKLPLSFLDRPHFDGACSRLRHLRGDLNGCVEIPCLNEQELDESLLTPGNRAIAEGYLAIHNPQRERGIILQALDVRQVMAMDQILFAGLACLLKGNALTGRHGLPPFLIPIRQKDVLHHLRLYGIDVLAAPLA